MPTPLGDIFVRIGAQTKDFERGLDRVQKASAKVFAGISAAVAGVGVIGAGFEKEITKVGALTDATGEKFDQLGKVARSVAAETEFTAKQAAEGMGFFAMAGFTAEQSMAALRPATILATTGFMDLGSAADIVTNVMSGFGLGFDELDKSIDVLVATASNANTTVEQLGEAMSYAAPVAKSFGISFEESAAAMGILSDAGIQASRAGTNLRMAMVKLAKPTQDAQAVLQKYGVEVFDSDGKMKSLTEIFRKFAGSGASATEMLKVFGPRAASAALILTESMKPGVDDTKKTLESFTQTLRDSGGRAEEIFERMSQTVGFQFNVLKSNVEEAALTIYDDLKPAMLDAIGLGQDLAKGIATLDPGIRALVKSFGLMTLGISGLALAFSTVGKAAIAAWAAMAGPIAPLIAAFAALAAAWKPIVDDWDKIKEVLSGDDKEGDAALKKMEASRNLLGISMGEGDRELFKHGRKAAVEKAYMDQFGGEIKDLSQKTKEANESIDGTAKVSDDLKSALGELQEQIEKTSKAVVAPVKKAGAGISKPAKELESLFEIHNRMVDEVLVHNVKEMRKAGDIANKRLAEVEKANAERRADIYEKQAIEHEAAVKDASSRIMGKLKQQQKQSVGRFAGDQAKAMMPGEVKGILQGAAQSGGSPWGAIIAFFFEILKKMKPILKAMDLIGEGFQIIADAFSPIFEGLSSAHEMMNDSLKDLMKAIEPMIKQLKRIFDVLFSFMGPVTDIINAIIEVVAAFIEPFLDIIATIVEGIGGALKEILKFFGVKFGPTAEELNKQVNDANDAYIQANTATVAAAESQNALTETTEKANQEITNIPQGFKLVGHMLDSILDASGASGPMIPDTPTTPPVNPGTTATVPAGETATFGNTMGGQVVIQIDKLSADGATLPEIAESVILTLEEQQYLETGAAGFQNTTGGQGRM